MNPSTVTSQFMRDLSSLAERYGIYPSYYDAQGKHILVDADTLLAVLNTIGVSIESEADLQRALEVQHRENDQRAFPPVVLSWNGEPFAFEVTVPLAEPPIAIRYEIVPLEIIDDKNTHKPLGSLQGELSSTLISQKDSTGTFRLHCDRSLPLGYYRLHAHFRTEPQHALLIVAPRKAPHAMDRRDWGVFLPLYASRSERNWGIGDVSDLTRLTDWVADQGGSFVGTLPLLASFLDEPYEFSPYSPASRLFWNEIFIDVGQVPEFSQSAAAQKRFASTRFQTELAACKAMPLVDYRRVMKLKREILFPLSIALKKQPKARRDAFKTFVETTRTDVLDYARFRAYGEMTQTSWHAWPESARSGDLSDCNLDDKLVTYFAYTQWIADEQLTSLQSQTRSRNTELYLDLPLGVNAAGYDIYRHRDLFLNGVSAGAPPDALFSQGQDWGFPPLNPWQLQRSEYAYLKAVLRHHLRFAKILRVDHIMGLRRMFLVPHGMRATQGTYLRYPMEELYALLCLEAHRAGAVLIGEDLGTVPEEVHHAMDAHALHRMHIVQYEASDGIHRPVLREPIKLSVAALNTHDMPTFAGYWRGLDIDDRVALGIASPEQAQEEHRARSRLRQAIVTLFANTGWLNEREHDLFTIVAAANKSLAVTEVSYLMLNLEDLWLEDQPQNVPGTYRERPNWQRKARFTLEELYESDSVRALFNDIALLRKPFRRRHERRKPLGHDPHTHTPTLLSRDDLYLFNEGTHRQLCDHLGAHPMIVDEIEGTYFSVWAPNAEQVSVVGDFNDWHREANPLSPRSDSGIWEGFVPGVLEGALYKFHIVSRHHYSVDKTDPFAIRSEVSPQNASMVWHLEYPWNDEGWMATRTQHPVLSSPIAIYEVHLGSWRRKPEEHHRPLSYRELAPLLTHYVKELGFTHVELLPIMEHPFYGSWGYQTTGYFSPTSRYGLPQDFMFLVDSLHRAGIGVILDWVPSHFPSDEHGLGFFDGTHLFEHADPRQGFHPDWKSAIFNYGRHEVRSFLLSSAAHWLSRFHADGLRVDAVASMLYLDYSRSDGEWIPNRYGGRENLEAIEFLRRLNEQLFEINPNTLMIAEESTAWPMVSRPTYLGGLGFNLKWDMGWMHDTLRYFAKDPIHRRFHHNDLTFRSLYAFHENFVLPLSHDEVVHGKGSLIAKMPGDEWQKFANLRLLFGYMYALPGKKMIFMGGEFGQWNEWNHETSLDWHVLSYPLHRGINRLVGDLNRLYRRERALYERDHDPSGFEWIDGNDANQSCLIFLRQTRDETMLIALNFTPVPRHNYLVGVPLSGHWQELLNTDAEHYGGSGIGNLGGVMARDQPAHQYPHSLQLTLPPLGALFLKHIA